MAVTLDTLELDIQSNSEGASSAVRTLIGSLKSMIAPVSNAIGPLKSLNKELQTLKANSAGANIGKILNSNSAASGAKKTSKDLSEALKSQIAIEKSQVRVNTIQRRPEGDYHYGTSPMDPKFIEAVEAQKERNKEWKDAIRGSIGTNPVSEVTPPVRASEAFKGVQEGTKDVKKTTSAFATLKKEIQGIFKGGLLQQFGRMLRMRAIRSVIMGLAKGFKEGIGNLREWSDGVNGHFSAAMNSAQDHLTLMKNSVATALAPAIEAAIPIFNVLTGAINAASNALAQFFALLTGKSSWTKATLAVGDYTKATKGAGGASKDLLADWDELNVIQSSGGGGGGGSGASVTDMFEEQYAFAEPIRDIVGFLKDNFEDILPVAIGIGTAIKAWGLSKEFEGTIGKILKGITGALVMFVTWKITDDSDKHFLGGEGVGWLFTNLLTNALGATVAGKIAKSVIGGKAGVITAAITLAISAGIDLVNAFESTNKGGIGVEEFATGLVGSAKAGIATALVAKGLGVTTGAAIAGGAITFGIVGIATLAVMAGIELTKDHLNWGNVELSEYEVRRFVESKMFTVDVNTVVNKINASLSDSAQARGSIEDLLLGINTEFNVVKLGLDEKTTYGNLQKYFTGDNGLISQVQNLIESNKDRLKLALTVAPMTDGEGNDNSASILGNSSSGWDTVSDWYSAKGRKLGDLLQKGIQGSIIDGEKDLLQSLIDEINNVTSAITQAKMQGSAIAGFRSDLDNLGLTDLSQNSVSKVLSLYNDYQANLQKGYEDLWKQAVADQQGLVAALFEIDPNGPEYAKAVADLEYMLNGGYEEAVKNAVDKATGPAQEMVQDLVNKLFGEKLQYFDFTRNMVGYLYGPDRTLEGTAEEVKEKLGIALKKSLSNFGIPIDLLNVFDISASLIPADVRDELQKRLTELFGKDVAKKIMVDVGFSGVDVEVSNIHNNPRKELTQQEQMEEDWHTYYKRNRKELLNPDGTPAMTVTTPMFAPMSDDTGSAITGKLDTLNGNIQQVVSAINAVNGTVQDKDTKPVVNVNIPGGSPMARFIGSAGNALNRVNG